MPRYLREYFRPNDWKTAQEMLQRIDIAVKPLFLSPRAQSPDQWPADMLVDLSQLCPDTISVQGQYLTIGILASLQALIDSPLVNSRFDGILSRAASCSGSLGLRNYANLGGVLTDPAAPAELLLALLALDAEVLLQTHQAQLARVPIHLFLTDQGELIEPGNIPMSILLPAAVHGSMALERVSRTPRDAAIVACVARLDIAQGVIATARIAISGASSRPTRLDSVEQLLEGNTLTHPLIQAAANAAEAWAKPCSNFRASAEYRRAMTRVLVHRVLQSAWEKAVPSTPHE